MRSLIARDVRSGLPVRLTLDGRVIGAVEPEGETTPFGSAAGDLWVAPAFWDIQTNGRWGTSFSDPTLTPDQVSAIVRAQASLGTARLCPTLITAPAESTRHGLKAIDQACRDDPDVDARVVGVHLEGPSISGLEGYRGAHPLDSVRDPDWDEFQGWQDASGGRIVLITLAPERTGAIDFIRKAVGSGVTVALGHTAADAPTLRAAVDAGATLSTHLGNGIASPLARHPNPIFDQAADDRLHASVIADGHHLDPATLLVLARAKMGRLILVSDASPLAGLPVGTYGPWAVDPSGKIVVAGTPYLAGSNQALITGINALMRVTSRGLTEALAAATDRPARLLGHDAPALDPGRAANLVVFRREGAGDSAPIRLIRVCVDGDWVEADEAPECPWPLPALSGRG